MLGSPLSVPEKIDESDELHTVSICAPIAVFRIFFKKSSFAILMRFWSSDHLCSEMKGMGSQLSIVSIFFITKFCRECFFKCGLLDSFSFIITFTTSALMCAKEMLHPFLHPDVDSCVLLMHRNPCEHL